MVLSPEFIEKLEELVVVMRPFVHWCVVIMSLSQDRPAGLIARSGSLNDMITIPDVDEDSSEGENDDADADEDEDA